MVRNGQCLKELTVVLVRAKISSIHEDILEPTEGAGPRLEEIGSSSLSRAPTKSLESVQNKEAGLGDIKSSVTQSLPWEPRPRMVFGIMDAPQAREYKQDFRPLAEFLRPRCFLSVAFICCLFVVSVFIVLETGLTRPGKSGTELKCGEEKGNAQQEQ